MAETFNPIISHLYSGQGGVSREITKYNNATISEINAVNNGVTTKYDFGGKYVEKMYSGDRVWNQLIENGNFASDSGWGTNNSSLSVSNNIGTLTASAQNGLMHRATAQVQGHKYLLMATIKLTTGTTDVRFSRGGSVLGGATKNTTDWQLVTYFYEGASTGNAYIGIIDRRSSGWDAIQVKNFQLFDLTLIYGAGNEPTTVAEFVHDYGDEYYPYNAGTNFSLATKLFNTIKQPLDSIKFYGNTMRWCQYSDCTNPTILSQAGNVISSKLFSFNTSHKYAFVFDWSFQTTYSGVRLTVGIWNNSMTIYNRKIFDADDKSKRYVLLSDGVASLDNQGGGTLDYTSVKIAVQVVDNSGEIITPSNTATISNVQCFDLTYVFGAGNEPTTVEEFTRRLKKLYYPFTNGEILSVEKASEYLYGINIWDEEWEVGSIDGSTGENDNSVTSLIRSKNYTTVISGETYYASIAGKNARIFYYDENKAFLSYYDRTGDGTFTVPTSASYIRFRMNTAYGTTYNHDICINLSDSSINGTYEASKGEQKMQLDSFNIWDEEWEVGKINWDGTNMSSSTNIRSKNYIRIVGGSAYYVEIPTSRVEVFYYDYNKSFISYEISSLANQTFTPPASACYMRFYTQQAYGTTYNNDICINLSDPSRNGIYVSYRRYVELNGINDVIDMVTVEKNVTLPFGLVDLGELTWYYLEASGHEAMYSTGIQSSAKHPSSDSTIANIVCGAFSTVTRNQQYNHSADFIIAMNTDGTLFVYSTTMGTTGASFKDSVKGKYLYYELADHPLNDTPILAGSYVKSAGTVDMGTLDWNYNSDRQAFYATISDAVDYTNSNVLCAKYPTVQMSVIWTGAQDKVCSMQNNYIGPGYNKRIVVRDTSYTDATTFKASVQGVPLCYELATPVETTLTAQQCAEILNGAFTKSKYSTLLTDNNNGQIDQTVDVGMWEQR